MIWAVDNYPDTFRIKIWYEEYGDEIVIYDNDMDQEIGGGSIGIKTKKVDIQLLVVAKGPAVLTGSLLIIVKKNQINLSLSAKGVV